MACEREAHEICDGILDLDAWPGFKGGLIVPGIRKAEFECRPPEIVGTVIRVENTDGSSHLERITRWEIGVAVEMTMEGFSAPLSRLATHFVECWDFQKEDEELRIRRSFALYPKGIMSRMPLWCISLFLRRAIRRHLEYVCGDEWNG